MFTYCNFTGKLKNDLLSNVFKIFSIDLSRTCVQEKLDDALRNMCTVIRLQSTSSIEVSEKVFAFSELAQDVA